MRLATTILALGLVLIVGFQSFAASVGGSLSQNETTSGAAGAGFVVALLLLIGGAFAIGVPIVSAVAFVLAAVISLAAGLTSDFRDLTVWGVVCIVLAVLSFFSFRARRRRPGRAGSQEPRVR
ncbi:MAG: hypothetical protein M3315_06830 [Actinomycetota bacterium]|nr:hypothetical protein [Actinomycetota bacterium]